jgi:hypothetical protein
LDLASLDLDVAGVLPDRLDVGRSLGVLGHQRGKGFGMGGVTSLTFGRAVWTLPVSIWMSRAFCPIALTWAVASAF